MVFFARFAPGRGDEAVLDLGLESASTTEDEGDPVMPALARPRRTKRPGWLRGVAIATVTVALLAATLGAAGSALASARGADQATTAASATPCVPTLPQVAYKENGVLATGTNTIVGSEIVKNLGIGFNQPPYGVWLYDACGADVMTADPSRVFDVRITHRPTTDPPTSPGVFTGAPTLGCFVVELDHISCRVDAFTTLNFVTEVVGFYIIHMSTPGFRSLNLCVYASSNLGTGALPTCADTTTALSSSLNPSSYGQSVTFTATVTPVESSIGTPTGSIQFQADGVDLGSPVAIDASGQASLTTSSLAGGDHSVTATYSGDPVFNGSTATASQHVDRITPTITWANPANITYGAALTGTQLNATASVSGSVVYTPAAGTVLNAGNGQTLHVQFTPDDTTDYNGASANATINVLRAPLTITAEDKNRPAGASNPTLTASYDGFVNGDLPGSLDIPVVLSTTAITSSPPGTYPIMPSGAGDSNYLIGYVNGTLTVGTVETSTVVASSVNPSLVGQAVTFTATISIVPPGAGTPTGTVQFKDGASNVGSPVSISGNQAQLTTSALSAGPHSISAVYGGDSTFGSSTGTVSQTVNKRSTATKVVPNLESVTVIGQAYQVLVIVNSPSGVPIGAVAVTDGAGGSCTANLISGIGSCLLTSLVPGTKVVTATYQENATWLSSSAQAKHLVTRASTTTSITNRAVLAIPTRRNGAYVVMWNVSVNSPGAGTPTGLVRISDGVTTCTASVAAGSCLMRSPTAGALTITATYLGDSNFATSADTARHLVTP